MRRLAVILLALALPSSATAATTTSGTIVFTSNRDGNEEIYAAAADGSNQRNLTQNPAVDRQAAWSADGSRIAFVSDRDGRQDLYVMDADGSAQTRITDGFYLSVDTEPSWSPDGKHIVFASTRPFNEGWHLWVVDADGSSLHQLTDGFGVAPAWSPDGTTVAYDGGGQIWLVGSDGTNPHPLVMPLSGVGPMSAPAWSPDGTRLAFSVQGPPNLPSMASIFVSAADGSSPQQVTDWGWFDSHPQWSRDGTTLLFQRYFGGGNPLELFSTTLDRRFQNVVVGSPGDNYQPSWLDPAPTPPPAPDTTPPAITIRVPNGLTDRVDVFTLGQLVAADYSCVDTESGVRHCEGPVASGQPIDTGSIGTKEFRVFSVDNAGNPVYKSAWYRVVFLFTGFDAPVVNGGWTDLKAGDGVPLKFSLGGPRGLDVVTRVSQQVLDCSSGSAIGAPAPATATLTYNGSQDRYLEVVASAKAWAGSCRSIALTLSDGTVHSAAIRFTK
ncbi:MAG TPA: LpqB family beta-propeller domain-containing protein [Gaiellaceae bacterium]|nr:LpqB family beta-propeller domain-containing protein [Gaiellaceae bacterium]